MIKLSDGFFHPLALCANAIADMCAVIVADEYPDNDMFEIYNIKSCTEVGHADPKLYKCLNVMEDSRLLAYDFHVAGANADLNKRWASLFRWSTGIVVRGCLFLLRLVQFVGNAPSGTGTKHHLYYSIFLGMCLAQNATFDFWHCSIKILKSFIMYGLLDDCLCIIATATNIV